MTKALLILFLCASPLARAEEISMKDFIHQIIVGHKFPLETQMHPGCAKETGRTLGDYFSLMLAGEGNAGERTFEFTCAPFAPGTSPFKPPKKGSPVECRLTVGQRAITARLTHNQRGIERKFIACSAK